MGKTVAFCVLAVMVAGGDVARKSGEEANMVGNKQAVLGYLRGVQEREFDWRVYLADTISFNGTDMPCDGVGQILDHFRSGFPDLTFEVAGQIAEGDRVATWGFFEGTHTGSFAGVDPTGKRIRWFGVGVDRLENGKVVEMWHEADVFGVVQQVTDQSEH